ncbi:MAG: hypothetical protein WCT51_04945 [Candidatus Shapirobacteria bacterium]|jgi:hypothetical protein
MKKEFLLNLVFGLIIILILFFTTFKVGRYLNAKIQYESTECSDRAYMIYKQYDDQIIEYKTTDWTQRTSECAEIEANYQKGF